MKKNVLLLLLIFLAIGCKENPPLPIEEEETTYGLFAIAPDKARDEAIKFVYAHKPLSKSSGDVTSSIQTIWRTLTINPSSASSAATRSQSEYTELVPVYVISFNNGGEDAGYIVTAGDIRVPERVLAFAYEGA